MNRELKKFLNAFREPDGIIPDLFRYERFNSVPCKSGAYIILSQSQKFVYPNGESTVFYIGMSTNLNSRIKKHIKISNKLNNLPKNEMQSFWYYSRYHYMIAFGCKLFWYTTRGKQTPKSIERYLIEEFYDKFYSLPTANGAFSF